MPDTEKKLKELDGLKKLLIIISSGKLSKEDLINSFKGVLFLLLKLGYGTEKNIQSLQEKYDDIVKIINDDSKFKKIQKEISSFVGDEFEKIKKEHNNKMDEVGNKLSKVKNGKDGNKGERGERGENGKDGKDGLPGKDGKDGSPDNPEQVRDKLETLKDGEKLSIQAIQDLGKMLEEIKQTRRLGGGGGFNYGAMNIHILDPYTPTGTINAVNTDFVLKHAPNPATSLKVYRGGQKQQLTTDFTLSGSGLIITFLIAPVVGEVIEVEHRI